MRQDRGHLLAADSLAGDDEDRVVSRDRGQDLSRGVRVDVRGDAHRVARPGAYHREVARELDVGASLSPPVLASLRQAVDVIPVRVVRFRDLQLLDVAREGGLRRGEAAVFQFLLQLLLVAELLCPDQLPYGLQALFPFAHC